MRNKHTHTQTQSDLDERPNAELDVWIIAHHPYANAIVANCFDVLVCVLCVCVSVFLGFYMCVADFLSVEWPPREIVVRCVICGSPSIPIRAQ